MSTATHAEKALQILRDMFDASQILDDPSNLEEFGKDWTKLFEPKPSCIFFPKSTADVTRLVGWANEHKMALVPSGGRTGLSGGAFAMHGEVVVSFQKMAKILEFNELDQTVTVEAGVVTETLQRFAEEKGLYFPVDFASRGSSQVGGNVATNAGGIKVLKYGLMRNWVSGLEVVTGAGQVLNLNNGLIKNATGYDLRQLFIGSEGTLGFITKVTLSLTRPPAHPTVFLFGVDELNSVMKIYHAFKSKLGVLAFEMFTNEALDCVVTHNPTLTRPFEDNRKYYVLVELEAVSEGVIETALSIFETGLEEGWILDGLQSQSPQQSRDLWRLREDISEATASFMPYKNDISVRISNVPQFLTEMDQILTSEYPDFRVVWFGHIGDGNLHVNILKPKDLSPKEFIERCDSVNEKLFQMIEKFHGSVSAEHGVGLTKKPFLQFTRSPEEIQLMRQIKKVFDPGLILNPGKVFDM